MLLRRILNKVTRPATPRQAMPAWLRQLGVVGFLFFLVKGLLWLLLPALLVAWRWVKG